ncbi:MAG: carboxymuconolactone decarboxylase family protein [Alphaproteobacteria bacterium]
MTFMPSLGEEATTFDVFSKYPGLYGPFVAFSESVFRGKGPLSIAERQFLFTYVSRLNECQYCAGGHEAIVEALGMKSKLLDEAIADIETASIDDRIKPLLSYIKKLTEEPTRMTQADADAVFSAGWSEEALERAIALCCLANFMNRLVDGHGIAAPPEDFARRAELAIEHGYLEPFLKMTGRSQEKE